MKINLKEFLLIIGLIATVIIASYPAYKFYVIFHNYEYSTKNQDWANVGSFFGGVYSAIFSFISVILLAVTLILTKKYNNQQLQILLTSQRKDIFCSLFDKLTQKMNAINYVEMGIQNEEDYFSYCEFHLFRDLASIKKQNDELIHAGTIIELSRNLLGSDWFENTKPYYDVVLITAEILSILDSSPEDDKRFFLAYMEANSSTKRLYWLFCFMFNYDVRYSDILIRNTRALRIPKGYV
ncbi:hypothetical protein [Enterobacter ludwigii]